MESMTVWLVAACAILVGTVLQRLSGTGVGLVCAPVLALLLGSAQGVLVTNATTTVSGFLIMLAVRRDVDWHRAGVLVSCAVPGAVTGALLARELSSAWLQVVLGSIVMLAIAVSAWLPELPHLTGRIPLMLAGLLGGAFNTTAGIAAPVMVVHSRLARWGQRSFQATLQPVFMTMGLLSVLAKTLMGATVTGTPPWWFPLVVVATVLAGIRIGARLTLRVEASRARQLALLLAGLGGAVSLLRGTLALAG